MLYRVPETTANLIGTLLRFLIKQIAVSPDAIKTLMQVEVPESHIGALQFLRQLQGDRSMEPYTYQMAAHPFGATFFRPSYYALHKSVTLLVLAMEKRCQM